MLASPNPTAKRNRLVIQELPSELLIYDLDTNKAHCLNASAAQVWPYCDGDHSVSDIAGLLNTSTGVVWTPDVVWFTVQQFSDSGLLEIRITPGTSQRTRREVMKTFGLAATVALPIVASLVAPKSALASASCTCVSPASCAKLSFPQCPTGRICDPLGICVP